MKSRGPLNVALKAAIFASGKRQGEIAIRARIYETRLSQIVNGWAEPTAEERKKLARVLKRDQSELFEAA